MKRLIIGKHPLNSSYGVWLSKPGVDAESTVDPDNFLIAPGAKNEMVLMVGQAANGATVFFPETLTDKPFVYFWPVYPGYNEYYPFPTFVVTKFGGTVCTVTPSYMSFSDSSGLGLSFNYFVINRSLP